MDELALAVLKAEMEADVKVFAEAVAAAGDRLGARTPTETEACSYHLSRAYNVLERLALRVARTFENHLDDRRGWHAELLRRMTLDVPGVRPALFPPASLPDLGDLRGFRHVVHHAYDLTLRPERVAMVLESVRRIAAQLPTSVRDFCDNVERRLTSNGST